MGFFEKIKQGLKKTTAAVTQSLEDIAASFVEVDDDMLEELEEALIMSDLGAGVAARATEELRRTAQHNRIENGIALRCLLKDVLTDMMLEDINIDISRPPAVILVIGVNGVGKTTSIGKLAARYVQEGHRVMLAAADTFRAAAADQLEIWARRAGADIVRHGEGADPAAVVFDAVAAARARDCDIIIIDTAGRLHNKQNLMNELNKIRRVADREAPDSSKEVLLVLDATTGQNGLIQAKQFGESAGLTGIVLTKLDGTAKGGIVLAIARELGVPVKFAGLGEGADDLQPFDAQEFVQALI